VFVALSIQYAERMRLIVICGLSGSTELFHITSMWKFSDKHLLNMKCVFWFFLQLFVRNISHS